MKRFYIDTSIWMDLYEDRKGFNGEPLGDYAWKLFGLIIVRNDRVILSDVVFRELEKRCSVSEIRGMIKPFEKNIVKLFADIQQRQEAKSIANERNLPRLDALHAILARDNHLVLITRDKHFRKLVDIKESYKPEELI